MRIKYLKLPKYTIKDGALLTEYHPVGCLVMEGDNYGLALCSPKDSFSKRLARTIAIGRLQKGGELAGRNVNPKSSNLYPKVREQVEYYTEKFNAGSQIQGVSTQ